MPYYEFRCQDCQKRVSLLFSYAEYDEAEPICTHCQSKNLTRFINRVVIGRGDDEHLAGMADNDMLSALDGDDPKALGNFMHKMSREMGEDLGDEFGEVVDRLKTGQAPEQIEKAMPDLGESTKQNTAGFPGDYA